MRLETHLRLELERLAGLKPGLGLGRVVVAVSGGRDSMALLHALRDVPMTVAHLDHGLRDGARGDAAFVQDVCAGLGVPCELEALNVPEIAAKRGWGIEETARRVRYDFLARTAKKIGANAILTAHTLEDNAETVLMQLLRGTANATGIPARRDRILRPLLGVSKAELEAYLRERGLIWREDETNHDTQYTRNWVRLEIMPLLRARFPQAAQKLAEHAKLATDEHDHLESQAARVPDWAAWSREPRATQRRLIRRTLEAAGVTPDLDHIEAIREALASSRVERISLPEDRTGVVQQGRLRVFDKAPSETKLEWPEGLDFSAFPWAKLRTRAAGDRIQLAAGTRKLSDVLIDRKVPRELRDTIPLVAQNSEVLWVGLEPPVLDVRIGQTHDAELEAMRSALELAHEALEAGEVPVGAVVIRTNAVGFLPSRVQLDPTFQAQPGIEFEVVGRGRNRSRQANDMTAHAELEAIRDACWNLERAHLNDCTLVVTLEPCLMCLGAILESRIPRVVFGARNPKNGALGGVMDVTRADWTHRISVRSGLRERECSSLLTAFFEGVRTKDEADEARAPKRSAP